MKKFLVSTTVLVALAAVGVVVATRELVDPATVKRDLIASVERQTGRELTIGSVQVSALPWPSLRATDVTLSDPEGFAHPYMLKAGEIRASVAVWPLLTRRLRLEDVTALHPVLWLARDEAGVANWRFVPREEPRHDDGGVSSHHARWHLEVGSARVFDGQVAWRDATRGSAGGFAIDRLDLEGLASDAPWVMLRAHHGAMPFGVSGHVGSLAVLGGAVAPWPVSVGVTVGAAGEGQDQVTLDGQIADVAHGTGYALTLRGTVPQLQDFNAVFPHAGLPFARGLQGEVAVSDAIDDPGRAVPHEEGLDFSERILAHLQADHVHLQVAEARLPRGLSISDAHVDAGGRTNGVAVTGSVARAGRTWRIDGTLGTLAQLTAAGRTRFGTALPVTVKASGDGTVLSAAGSVGGGTSVLDVEGHSDEVPLDYATLHDVGLKGHVESRGSGFAHVSGFVFSSREAGVDGDLTWARGSEGGRPVLSGRVHSDHLDMDAFQRFWTHGDAPKVAVAPPSAGNVPTVQGKVVQGVVHAPPVASGSAPPVEVPAAPPLPKFVRLLRRQDADLDLLVDHLTFDAADYQAVHAVVALKGGALRIDPLSGRGPDMQLAGHLGYDASVSPSRLALEVSPLVLPARVVERALKLPLLLRGAMEVVGSVTAEGDTVEALRRSAGGHLGVSMVGGRIDARILSALVGHTLGVAFGRTDTDVRCVGVHMTLADDVATLDTIGLQSDHVTATGTGTVGLGDDALALHLLPVLGIGGAGASAPVEVTGTLNEPRAVLGRSADGRFNLTLGGEGLPDPCPSALNAAREGVAGPMPGAVAHHHSRAGDLLRSLGIFH